MKFTRTHEFEYDSDTVFQGEIKWVDNSVTHEKGTTKIEDYEVTEFSVFARVMGHWLDVTRCYSDEEIKKYEEKFLLDVRRKHLEESA